MLTVSCMNPLVAVAAGCSARQVTAAPSSDELTDSDARLTVVKVPLREPA